MLLMVTTYLLPSVRKGCLLGFLALLSVMPVNANEKISFNVFDFIGATLKKGCEGEDAMKKYVKSSNSWLCYETNPPGDEHFSVKDMRNDPRWNGLYDQDSYLFITYSGGANGYGRFWGKGDVKGVLKDENGFKYSVTCLGLNSTGMKYGYCVMHLKK